MKNCLFVFYDKKHQIDQPKPQRRSLVRLYRERESCQLEYPVF